MNKTISDCGRSDQSAGILSAQKHSTFDNLTFDARIEVNL